MGNRGLSNFAAVLGVVIFLGWMMLLMVAYLNTFGHIDDPRWDTWCVCSSVMVVLTVVGAAFAMASVGEKIGSKFDEAFPGLATSVEDAEEDDIDPNKPVSTICPHCGGPFEGEGLFCPLCGKPLR